MRPVDPVFRRDSVDRDSGPQSVEAAPQDVGPVPARAEPGCAHRKNRLLSRCDVLSDEARWVAEFRRDAGRGRGTVGAVVREEVFRGHFRRVRSRGRVEDASSGARDD